MKVVHSQERDSSGPEQLPWLRAIASTYVLLNYISGGLTATGEAITCTVVGSLFMKGHVSCYAHAVVLHDPGSCPRQQLQDATQSSFK
jgi:hypothetical protein